MEDRGLGRGAVGSRRTGPPGRVQGGWVAGPWEQGLRSLDRPRGPRSHQGASSTDLGEPGEPGGLSLSLQGTPRPPRTGGAGLEPDGRPGGGSGLPLGASAVPLSLSRSLPALSASVSSPFSFPVCLSLLPRFSRCHCLHLSASVFVPLRPSTCPLGPPGSRPLSPSLPPRPVQASAPRRHRSAGCPAPGLPRRTLGAQPGPPPKPLVQPTLGTGEDMPRA